MNKTQDFVSFACSDSDRRTANKIAYRAIKMYEQFKIKDRTLLDIEMDIIATHCNGNPLRLDDLLNADDFNFMHDISGIATHLNRDTGKLEDFFRPRFSRK
jgi:uncharacterized protein DUF6874